MLINFFGKRGAGKTTAIKGQLEDCRGPVVVCDILGNFQNPEWVLVDTPSQAIEKMKYYLENPDSQKIIVVKCADPDLTVDYVSAALWEAGGGTLVLDEADGFSLATAPCFDNLVRYGRNRNVDIITGCRRPAEISRNITAGANKLFAFQTQEPRDIEYFRSTVFGDEAERLTTIEKYHGLFIDYDQNPVLIAEFRIDEEGRIYKLKTAGKSGKNQKASDEMVSEDDEETLETGEE